MKSITYTYTDDTTIFLVVGNIDEKFSAPISSKTIGFLLNENKAQDYNLYLKSHPC